MLKVTHEGFKPVKNEPPTTFPKKLKFYGRMLLDLQLLTIYSDIKKILPHYKGRVLDIGCGQSPYKFLLNKDSTEYKGIDVPEAVSFNYVNNEITLFDGEHIPFPDNTFDAFLCTEVMEHVYNFQLLVDEMHRVCKLGAKGVITIPFSTRYHYIPHDFFRYTPSALERIFSGFSKVEIAPRGRDITSACAKIIVLFSTNIIPDTLLKIVCLPFWIFLSPLFFLSVLVAHISLIFNLGSELDPLGYTIKLTK